MHKLTPRQYISVAVLILMLTVSYINNGVTGVVQSLTTIFISPVSPLQSNISNNILDIGLSNVTANNCNPPPSVFLTTGLINAN